MCFIPCLNQSLKSFQLTERMNRFPPWSELPQELLSAIAERLRSNSIDIRSFRFVCKSWCSSSSSSITLSKILPPLPLIIPSVPSSLRSRCYIRHDQLSTLSVTVAYAIRRPTTREYPPWVPKAWVVFIDQVNPNKVSIRDPFSQTSYALPTSFPETVDLLSFDAIELGRFHSISYLTSRRIKRTKLSLFFGLVRKVVLYSSDDGAMFAVVLSDDGKLGVLELGVGETAVNLGAHMGMGWETIHDGKGFRFDDILVFKGKMLGIDRRGRVYKIVIGRLINVMMTVIVPPVNGGGGRRKRLVESLGCLYLIVRHSSVPVETGMIFKVFVLREDVQKWDEVKSLGDRTFFIGVEFSFSVSAEDLHGSYGKNCVLFKKSSFLNYKGDDDDVALFSNLGHNELSIGVWSLENVAHVRTMGSDLGYSDVLWPPPSWFWKIDKSQRLNALETKLNMFRDRISQGNLTSSFDGVSLLQQKESAFMLMMQANAKMEYLKKVREMENDIKKAETTAVSLHKHIESANRLYQVIGTSSVGSEERSLSIESLRTALRHCNSGMDWFAREKQINAFILQFEENLGDFENALLLNKF